MGCVRMPIDNFEWNDWRHLRIVGAEKKIQDK
jgi:hypothetical protein